MKTLFDRLRKKALDIWYGPEHKRHPAEIFDARVELPKQQKIENPHLTKWKAYTVHLFSLMVEGHSASPPAMQVRDIIRFHWDFMSNKERGEAAAFYYEQKYHYLDARESKLAQDAAKIRNKQAWRELQDELDEFMNPKSN